MATNDSTYRMPTPKPLHRGLDSVVHGWIGRYQRRQSIGRDLMRDARQVDTLATKFEHLSDHALREALMEYRLVFRRKPSAEDEIHALAAIREASFRTLGLKPFVVQLAGALALCRGYLVEMATGEGKTLTAGLAAILIGWKRKPFHLITVNDYLVERDARWLASLYEFCRIRVGTVVGESNTEQRRAAHRCDVTYTTSRELLADLLRDQMKQPRQAPRSSALLGQMLASSQEANQPVLRGIHTAIVDEADSILIDEAVTPLIISSPRPNPSLKQAIHRAETLARQLVREEDYTIDPTYREVQLTRQGKARATQLAHDWPGIWRSALRREELLKQALVAHNFFEKGKQYILQDDKVVIVDEFTGRPMPQRSWRQGLHQAIEVKEGLEPSDPNETVARMSFQRFFRCFVRLSGMTGTAAESSSELWRIYELATVRLPHNKPCIRREQPSVIVPDQDRKYDAILKEVESLHAEGRPVLIGTRSVSVSEAIGRLLEQAGLPHQILNATRLQEEAMVVARAGERGRITVATNMAGRGTDIKLDKGVADLGGLHVIATEPHESSRVDRQLFGRAGRQGDPGTCRLFASLEDEIILRTLSGAEPSKWRQTMIRFIPGGPLFRLSQWVSERRAYRQRLAVLRSDRWLDESLSFAGK